VPAAETYNAVLDPQKNEYSTDIEGMSEFIFYITGSLSGPPLFGPTLFGSTSPGTLHRGGDAVDGQK
jgi:hypothetical protein